jgi:molybdate transport system substrate-binding protein
MNRNGWRRLIACATLFASALTLPAPSRAANPEELTVAAAADLAFAFKEVGGPFERATGSRVTFSFGSTGMLALQIANGAPFDVLAAADVRYVEDLKAKGLLINDSQRLYAQGRIVVVVNKKTGVVPRSIHDLLNPSFKKIAIANPDHAPYGMAAQQALKAARLWEALHPRIVYGENIRQTLQFVQTGNADAGIVARSVANVPEVTYALVPDSLHAPLNQALAIVKTTRHERLARAFIEYLNGPRGRPIMKNYGFLLPGEF